MTTKSAKTDQLTTASTVGANFLQAFAETRGFRLGYPAAVRPTPDEGAVLFLRGEARNPETHLYELDVASGAVRQLINTDSVLAGEGEEPSLQEQARRERMRVTARGLTSYDLSSDGRQVLFPLSGRLYLYDRVTEELRALVGGGASIIDPRFSPDGSKVAYVRGYDVFVTDVQTGTEIQVTSGGTEDVTHGLAEFVAQEEMRRFEGYWWSPDTQVIAFEEADHTKVERLVVADPVSPSNPPSVFPYARPGKPNVTVRLGIASIDGSQEPVWVQWDTDRYPYLAHVTWDEKSAPLTVLVQARDQREQALLSVDPRSGETVVLLTEKDDAWINLVPGVPRWLPGGSGFLWASDRSGRQQLELRGPDGELERVLLTEGDPFEEIVHVSPDGKHAVVRTAAATRTGLVRVPVDGGTPSPIVGGSGEDFVEYHAAFSSRGGIYVVSQTSVWDLPRSEVYRSDGSRLADLPTTAEAPPLSPAPQISTVVGPDGLEYVTAIVRPHDFDRTKRYPVIVSVYGGPHGMVVALDQRSYLLQQWLANQGAIVVLIDNRGTPRRDRAWERAIKGSFGRVPLNDQVAALQALGARYKELDLTRVGIYGWSFGGYMAALAVLKRPDIFTVGVAGAPVVDWLDYDTHYTERYLDLPDHNPEGYEESSLLSYAGGLEQPLLLIHGTSDDNVYFFHSLKLADALFRAGRRFEFLPLVGMSHMVFSDALVAQRLYERVASFLLDHLR